MRLLRLPVPIVLLAALWWAADPVVEATPVATGYLLVQSHYADGRVAPYSDVCVYNTARKVVLITRTNDRGAVNTSLLPLGTYRVVATNHGRRGEVTVTISRPSQRATALVILR